MEGIAKVLPRLAYDFIARLLPGIWALGIVLYVARMTLTDFASLWVGSTTTPPSEAAQGVLFLVFSYLFGLVASPLGDWLHWVVLIVLRAPQSDSQQQPNAVGSPWERGVGIIERLRVNRARHAEILRGYDVVRNSSPERADGLTRTRAEYRMYGNLFAVTFLAFAYEWYVTGFLASPRSIGLGALGCLFLASTFRTFKYFENAIRNVLTAGMAGLSPHAVRVAHPSPWHGIAILGHGTHLRSFLKDPEAILVGTTEISTPFGSISLSRVRMSTIEFTWCDRYQGDLLLRADAAKAIAFAIASVGHRQVISINGVGSLSEDLAPGDIYMVRDFIGFHPGPQDSFYGEVVKCPHVRLNPPLCPSLTDQVIASAPALISSRPLVYASVGGPRFDTPAEVQFLRRAGGDVVGMQVGLEAPLFRELEVCYAAIAFVMNKGEGISGNTPGATVAGLKSGLDQDRLGQNVAAIMRGCITHNVVGQMCGCGRSLDDWRGLRTARIEAADAAADAATRSVLLRTRGGP